MRFRLGTRLGNWGSVGALGSGMYSERGANLLSGLLYSFLRGGFPRGRTLIPSGCVMLAWSRKSYIALGCSSFLFPPRFDIGVTVWSCANGSAISILLAGVFTAVWRSCGSFPG